MVSDDPRLAHILCRANYQCFASTPAPPHPCLRRIPSGTSGHVLVHLETILTCSELTESETTLCRGRYFVRRHTIFTPEASKLEGSNYRTYQWMFLYLNKVLRLTFSKYSPTASWTRLMRSGKIIHATGGINGFESALVSSSDFKSIAARRVW